MFGFDPVMGGYHTIVNKEVGPSRWLTEDRIEWPTQEHHRGACFKTVYALCVCGAGGGAEQASGRATAGTRHGGLR